MSRLHKILTVSSLALGLAACAHSDDPNSYENTFGKSEKLAAQRDAAKWASLENAGWCIPRSSYFPRPRPSCTPLPPGGVAEAQYRMAKGIYPSAGYTRDLALGINPAKEALKQPPMIKPKPPTLPPGFPTLPPGYPFGLGRVNGLGGMR